MNTEKTIQIFYGLTEAGQKQSILTGGNGKRYQSVSAPLSPEILNWTTLDPDGDPEALRTYTYHYTVAEPTWGRPYIKTHGHQDLVLFDAPQTSAQLINWLRAEFAARDDRKAAAEAELAVSQAQYEQKEAEQKEAEAARKAAHEQFEQMIAQERQRKENAKNTWIDAHGSDYLKRATALGYDCQRRYVAERATFEFPGYVVDFDDQAGWNARVCPSTEALSEAERQIAAGHNAEIVWLTQYPDGTLVYDDDDWDEEEEEEDKPDDGVEAVVIHNFLAQYDLIRVY